MSGARVQNPEIPYEWAFHEHGNLLHEKDLSLLVSDNLFM